GRRDGRMGFAQIPLGAVFARRQAVCCPEVPAHHLAAPSAFKTDHKVSAIRSVDCDGRLRDHGDFASFRKLGQGSVDEGDKVWEIACSCAGPSKRTPNTRAREADYR